MHRLLVLALLGLLPAVGAVARAAQPPPLTAKHGMVASASPHASRAGVEVLQAGGNAVDAAVTTSLVLSVTEPYSSGIGGGGFAVIFDAASRKVATLDFRERAPAAATRDMYVRNGKADTSLSQTGALAVAVPGQVRGLWELHKAQGRLPWARLVEPAARLAREGFEVTPLLRKRLAASRGRLDAEARSIFLPEGKLPKVGTRLVQADLAATLDAIGERGAAAFYEGPVAEAIVRSVRSARGIMTLEDLAAYAPVWREPIRGTYRGATVYSMPPPSSGGVHLIEMLHFLSGFDLAKTGWGAAATVHPMVEAMKFAYAERSQFLGDPDFVDVPVDRLTSPDHAKELRKRFRTDKAIPVSEVEGIRPRAPEGTHTSHFSIVDADGNAVACTQTINLTFGAGMVAAGTGVVLNDEMDDFSAAPGVPNAFGLIGSEANAVAGRKRPLSSMTPTIVVKDDKVLLVAGSPGGSRIITAVLQVVVNVLDFGMDVSEAVGVPRIHHQWSPPDVTYEPRGLSPDTVALLQKKGHPMKASWFGTNAQAILVDPKTGELSGASDPRGEGAPAGY